MEILRKPLEILNVPYSKIPRLLRILPILTFPEYLESQRTLHWASRYSQNFYHMDRHFSLLLQIFNEIYTTFFIICINILYNNLKLLSLSSRIETVDTPTCSMLDSLKSNNNLLFNLCANVYNEAEQVRALLSKIFVLVTSPYQIAQNSAY